MIDGGEATCYAYDTPLPCLKWAESLHSLLQDRDGAELFKKYADSQGGVHMDRVKFYFAIEGLKQTTDPQRVKQVIGAIYK